MSAARNRRNTSLAPTRAVIVCSLRPVVGSGRASPGIIRPATGQAVRPGTGHVHTFFLVRLGTRRVRETATTYGGPRPRPITPIMNRGTIIEYHLRSSGGNNNWVGNAVRRCVRATGRGTLGVARTAVASMLQGRVKMRGDGIFWALDVIWLPSPKRNRVHSSSETNSRRLLRRIRGGGGHHSSGQDCLANADRNAGEAVGSAAGKRGPGECRGM